jgi:hypothetical protein
MLFSPDLPRRAVVAVGRVRLDRFRSRDTMRKAATGTVISHWYKLLEPLAVSPMDFYRAVEYAFTRRQVPQIENGRIDYQEAGLLSARREYLQITRSDLVFDICGAPFVNGFFVSWWLSDVRPSFEWWVNSILIAVESLLTWLLFRVLGLWPAVLVLVIGVPVILAVFNGILAAMGRTDWFLVAIPGIGRLYELLFKPFTYYRLDTALMFQQSVHAAVLEVIDGLTTANGLRSLTESERKPILREFKRIA